VSESAKKKKIQLRPKTQWRLEEVAKKLGMTVGELLAYGGSGDLRFTYSGKLCRHVEYIDAPLDADKRYHFGSHWESKIVWTISKSDIEQLRQFGVAHVRESMVGGQLQRLEESEEPLRLKPNDLFIAKGDLFKFLKVFKRNGVTHGNRAHGETREDDIVNAANYALEHHVESCRGKSGRVTIVALSEFLFQDWSLLSKKQQPKGNGGQPLSPETMRRNQLKKGIDSGIVNFPKY
jgi:hypothetical protein